MDLTLYCCFLSLVLIQQHQAYPSSKPGPAAEGPAAEGPAAEGPAAEGPEAVGLPAQLVHRAPRREKRCSCENPRDKECVYFCHVGILWVNTPSQVVSGNPSPVERQAYEQQSQRKALWGKTNRPKSDDPRDPGRKSGGTGNGR
ncbi:hypothetical protein NHX12_026125 [Muraenolepis orangiensis]|uniref:Endothelin-like toxin domain-containing protein n=1 Tax=Muraenolepis orangiensis TaxID=630683 RepID=A0A9Q0EFZ2_9TELE|nr:hypothetical protein NHX12_026125 [Muraenolepis orangiensis]